MSTAVDSLQVLFDSAEGTQVLGEINLFRSNLLFMVKT